MENKKLEISEEYLSEILDFIGRSLVGKVMKRYEIIENRDVLKSELKELIYEEIRNLKNLILAHDRGLNMTAFKFITKNTEKNSSK